MRIDRLCFEFDDGETLILNEDDRPIRLIPLDWHVPTPWLTRHCDRLWRI